MANKTKNNDKTIIFKSTNPVQNKTNFKPSVEYRHPNTNNKVQQAGSRQKPTYTKPIQQKKASPSYTKTKAKSKKNSSINPPPQNKKSENSATAIIIFGIIFVVSLMIIITALMFKTNLFGIMS